MTIENTTINGKIRTALAKAGSAGLTIQQLCDVVYGTAEPHKNDAASIRGRINRFNILASHTDEIRGVYSPESRNRVYVLIVGDKPYVEPAHHPDLTTRRPVEPRAVAFGDRIASRFGSWCQPRWGRA